MIDPKSKFSSDVSSSSSSSLMSKNEGFLWRDIRRDSLALLFIVTGGGWGAAMRTLRELDDPDLVGALGGIVGTCEVRRPLVWEETVRMERVLFMD
jgi:hypothetical protein